MKNEIANTEINATNYEKIESNGDNRRNFLKGMLGLSGAAFTAVAAKASVLNLCALTPAQTEGPFYPISEQTDTNYDLTRVDGRSETAKGEVVYLSGSVLDAQCKPVAGAMVEIWQACESGKYNHPGDRANPAPLDENFQYWGRVLSDEQGKFFFKTIKPGSYEASVGWIRPPHIHFKVQKRGFFELTSQLYFEGEPHNHTDRILQSLSPGEQEAVTVKLLPYSSPHHIEVGAKVAIFNITLRRP